MAPARPHARHVPLVALLVCTVPVVVLTCGGCSGKTPEELHPVTGTVRVGGRPMESGTILFEMINTGESGKRYTSRSLIDSQGRYRLNTFGEDGAPAGRHRVWVAPNLTRLPDKIGTNPMRLISIPDKYMQPTTTDLHYEVKLGENTIDVDVPAKQ